MATGGSDGIGSGQQPASPISEYHKPKGGHGGKRSKRGKKGKTNTRSVVEESPVETPKTDITPPSSVTVSAEKKKTVKQRTSAATATKGSEQTIGDQLDASKAELKKLIQDIGPLTGYQMSVDLRGSYDHNTNALILTMEQLKQKLTQHFKLADEVHKVILQQPKKTALFAEKAENKTAKNPEHAKDLALLASIGTREGADEKYWKERLHIASYAVLINFLSNTTRDLLPKVISDIESPSGSMWLGRFIPNAIDCLETHDQLALCRSMLDQKTQKKRAIEIRDNSGLLLLELIGAGVSHFGANNTWPQFRELLNTPPKCYEEWLGVYLKSDDDVPDHIRISMMMAYLVLDNPNRVSEMLQDFQSKVMQNQYDAADIPRLCVRVLTTLPCLFDRPEPVHEHIKRVEAAETILQHLTAIATAADQSPLISLKQKSNLISLMPAITLMVQVERAAITSIEKKAGDEGQKLTIKEKAENAKQAGIRQRIEEGAQRHKENEIRKKRERKAAAQKKEMSEVPSEPLPKGDLVHSGLRTAVTAFIQGRPFFEVRKGFDSVDRDPSASPFDKAQAYYGMADILAYRLEEDMSHCKKIDAHISAYDTALNNPGLPDIQTDINFREAMGVYQERTHEMSINIIQMRMIYAKAWDCFTRQDELKEEFMERLVDLRYKIDELVADRSSIVAQCKIIPEIFSARGERVRECLGSTKTSSDKKFYLKNQVLNLERSGEQIERLSLLLQQDVLQRDIPEPAARAEKSPLPDLIPSASPPPETTTPAPPPAPITVAGVAEATPIQPPATLPPLPADLRQELMTKCNKLPLSEVPAPMAFTSDQIKNLHPESGISPHPLTQCADYAHRALEISADGARWVIEPGQKPVPHDEAVIPKNVLTLNYDLTLPRSSPPPDVAANEALKQAVTDIPRSPSPPQLETDSFDFSSSFDPLAPFMLVEAIAVSLEESRKEWDVEMHGIHQKSHQWKTSKPKTKARKNIKATEVPAATAEPLPIEKVNLGELQGLLRHYLQTVVRTGKTPRGTSADAVICLDAVKKRAMAGTLFQSDDLNKIVEDLQFLADALDMPIRFSWKTAHSVYCSPAYLKPVEGGMSDTMEQPHITLEKSDSKSLDLWFASNTHYFHWCDAQDDVKEAAKAAALVTSKGSQKPIKRAPTQRS